MFKKEIDVNRTATLERWIKDKEELKFRKKEGLN
jgi:hypothetical protein